MPWITEDNCTGCGICVRECPVEAIRMEGKLAHIDDAVCIRCGKCHDVCPAEAVRHDGERLPLLQEANREWVERLLTHYETRDERAALLGRLKRHFANQSRLANDTIDWIDKHEDQLQTGWGYT